MKTKEVDHVVWISQGRYEHKVTTECFKGGSGSCDGYSPSNESCECPCHSADLPMPDGEQPKVIGDYAIAHKHYWDKCEIRRAYGVVEIEC